MQCFQYRWQRRCPGQPHRCGGLEVAGGGTVVFYSGNGSTDLSTDGNTTDFTAPTTIYTGTHSVASNTLSGYVEVASGAILSLTGTGEATPVVIRLEYGATISSTTAAIGAAILSLGYGDK